MKTKHPKGFTAIEAILIIVFLAILIGIGRYVYVNRHKKTSQSATNQQSTTVATTPAYSANAALSQVKSMYTAYLNANKSGDLNQVATVRQKYLTTTLNDSLEAKVLTSHEDVLTCQQTFSQSYSYTINSSTSTNAQISVTGLDNIPGVTNPTVIYVVSLSDLKISSTSCVAN